MCRRRIVADKHRGVVGRSRGRVIHAGGDAYDEAYRLLWQRNGVTDPVYEGSLRNALFGGDRTILDTVAALVLGNVFGRFPRWNAECGMRNAEWEEGVAGCVTGDGKQGQAAGARKVA